MKMKNLNGGALVLSLILIQSCSSVNYVIESNGFYYQSSKNIKKWVMPHKPTPRLGKWTKEAKEGFAENCENAILTLKDTDNGKIIQAAGVNFEEFAKKSCDCALKKVEKEYANPSEASKDNQGLTKIGGDCGKEVMMELMKK